MTKARATLRGRVRVAFEATLALLLGAFTACGSTGGPSPTGAPTASHPTVLNQRLTDLQAMAGDAGAPDEDYRVGPEDVLELSVFQAEEFDRTLRVRPDGSISLPLIGRLEVSGRTTSELEHTLAERLGEKYLRNPQVSVFVQEFRAHPVSVLGEVNTPGVYYLRRPRRLVEILTEAGGLTEEAGTILHLRRKSTPTRDRDVAAAPNLVTIDLTELLESPDSDLGPLLRDYDSIYVPKAGVVFVEGAVEKPGAYPLHGAATVLKAIALAGGLEGTARRSKVKVIRSGALASEAIYVDFDDVRRDPEADVRIHDGDVVVVESSLVKTTLLGLYRGLAGLVNVTKGF